MKNILLGLVLLFSLTQCNDTNLETPAARLLVGSWQNTATEHTITFGKDHHYSVSFLSDTAFSAQYRLGTLKDDDKLYIYDDAITIECKYQFLGDDELALTMLRRLGKPYLADTEKNMAMFKRIVDSTLFSSYHLCLPSASSKAGHALQIVQQPIRMSIVVFSEPASNRWLVLPGIQ